ncbi:HAD family phosphatase [Bacteroides sp. 519]|uniref:HAD family hydrolase n=1 Tax=Bacteroides sp. 519 TaxID=2302937 RepID=UPI0013D27C95|nr:HAD family hydrolase [Bacteroides sp. 519]NDV58580.1 HAD family hydrolase [Bacteroides sp. 519]
MENQNKIAALFDFDGVVMDTEPQYTIFWDKQGHKYLDEIDFGKKIKGQTLKQIFDKYFSGMYEEQDQITKGLDKYEEDMTYEYLPGIKDFIGDLKANHVRTALVTSSNENKMNNVYHVHPEMKELFDHILTAECFTRSKPDPECFLSGMKLLDATPENSIVFEDSFHGLTAGRASGATVVGLATTNTRESLEGKADIILDDFKSMTFEKLKQLV